MIMRRWVILSVIAAALLFTASVIGWMVGTERGNRFIIETTLKLVPAKIDITKTSGILIDKLSIEGISVSFPKCEIKIKKMDVSLRLSHLTVGMVVFKSVIFNDVSIISLNPDKPVNIEWPSVPTWLSWVNGGIKKLSIDRLMIYSKDEKFFEANNFDGEMFWRFGVLGAKNATIEMPFGNLEGNASAGFIKPSLKASIGLVMREKLLNVDRILVDMHLKHSVKPEHVSGVVTAKALSGKNTPFSIKGNIALTNNDIKFKEMVLTEKGREGKAFINGKMDFSYKTKFDLNIKLSGVDLKRELKLKTSFSGTIGVIGNPWHYNGSVYIQNEGKEWKNIHLKGVFNGGMQYIHVTAIKGEFLEGKLDGSVRMSWADDFFLVADVKGRNMDPSRLVGGWKGKINTDATGSFKWTKKNVLNGEIRAEFLKSTLRNKALTGLLNARWASDILQISAFTVRGDGFDISASGFLDERLNYIARVSNLSGLLPNSKGKISISGWTRLRDKKIAGTLKGDASTLSFSDLHVDSANIDVGIDEDKDIINAKINASNLGYGIYRLNSLVMTINGKLIQHNMQVLLNSKEGNMHALLSGSYKNALWSGNVHQFSFTDKNYGVLSIVKPYSFEISHGHLRIGNIMMSGKGSERLEADAKLDLVQMKGHAKLDWHDVNAARINPYLSETKIFGNTSGSFENEWISQNRIRMIGTASIEGSFIKGAIKSPVMRSSASLRWDEKGLVSSGSVDLENGGNMFLQFLSTQPAYAKMPVYGQLKCSWNEVDAHLLNPFLHDNLEFKGKISGKITGRLIHDMQFDISGQTFMTGGRFAWKRDEGRISFATEKANLFFTWRDSFLTGGLDFVLPSYGQMKGSFKLPISARLPLKHEPHGQILLESHGKMREKGMVSAIFPGLVEETGGQVDFHVSATGTWLNPDYKGWLTLDKARAFFPVAGVLIKDIGMKAELNNDKIQINSFNATSGKGNVEGSAMVWVKDWRIDRFKGKISGKRFQAVYVPEIQLEVNPDVAFEGNEKVISINGSVEVPEAIINQGESKKGAVHTSPDINIIDAPVKEKKKIKGLNFDARIMVLLGNNVVIKSPGVDARLEGKVLLTGKSIEKINGEGQIKIVRGQYSGYGTKLDVTRGNIVFNGKPVELASLDIMALRTINTGRFNEVKAGVIITGTPQSPLINLYSEPSMSEADVLSYIVLGRPIRVEGETSQSALLLRSASAFLSGGKTGSLQSRLMQKIGIDTLDVETSNVSGFGTGTLGTSIKTGTPGKTHGSPAGTSQGGATVERSLVTIGKYLAPGLYVAYGRSLFTEEYLLTTRYSFTKKIEIESKTGIETGVDLYYKIEFD